MKGTLPSVDEKAFNQILPQLKKDFGKSLKVETNEDKTLNISGDCKLFVEPNLNWNCIFSNEKGKEYLIYFQQTTSISWFNTDVIDAMKKFGKENRAILFSDLNKIADDNNFMISDKYYRGGNVENIQHIISLYKQEGSLFDSNLNKIVQADAVVDLSVYNVIGLLEKKVLNFLIDKPVVKPAAK